jgi:hypothetical protein
VRFTNSFFGLQYFKSRDAEFECKDSLDPIVTTTQCFDDLLIPPGNSSAPFQSALFSSSAIPAPLLTANARADHQSRRPSDTYYLDDQRLLRTHTS